MIQKLWYERVASPKSQPLFHRLTNNQGYSIPIKCLPIAWHRPPNLGNLLSYRKLSKQTGWKYCPTSRLDSNRPLIFWAGTERLTAFCPLLKKYFSLHLILILKLNLWGYSVHPLGFLFQEKGYPLSLFWNPFSFFLHLYFPPHPKIWTLVHQKLAHVHRFCIRLLQGEHWCCLTQTHLNCHNLPPEEINWNTRPVLRSLAVNEELHRIISANFIALAFPFYFQARTYSLSLSWIKIKTLSYLHSREAFYYSIHFGYFVLKIIYHTISTCTELSRKYSCSFFWICPDVTSAVSDWPPLLQYCNITMQ